MAEKELCYAGRILRVDLGSGKISLEPSSRSSDLFMGGDGIGMEMMAFMRDMPLPELLHLFGAPLPTSPEDFVDGLLAQARAIQPPPAG